MYPDEFILSPSACRVFLKALVACSKCSEFCAIITSNVSPDSVSVSGMHLSLSAMDPTATIAVGFDFPSVFFLAVPPTDSRPSSPAASRISVQSRTVVKAFRNISPNKILHCSIKLSPDSLHVEFKWRTGTVSSRTLPVSCAPEAVSPPQPLPPDIQLDPILLSFSPKYLHRLIALIPSSASLWYLTISYPARDPSRASDGLYFTNLALGSVEADSVVEMTVLHSEMNRNGSLVHTSTFLPGDSIRIPLTELNAMVALAADDALGDAFVIEIGYSVGTIFTTPSSVLTVRAVPKSQGRMLGTVPLNASLSFKTCVAPPPRDPPAEAAATQETYDGIKLEDINLDEIDPHIPTPFELDTGDDDYLLAAAVELIDSSTPSFIEHTAVSTDNSSTTQEQQSPETRKLIPEWESDIPATPTSVSAKVTVSTFDALWL